MKKRYIGYGILCLLIVGLDILTKALIDQSIKLYDQVVVIKDFFWLTNYRNTGAGWSILEGQMSFFYIVTIAALGYIGYNFYKTKEKEILLRIGLSLLTGGLLGNFIDRLTYQYVRDFLAFNIFGYRFPIFNVADIAITIGVGFVILQVGLEEYHKWKQSKSL